MAPEEYLGKLCELSGLQMERLVEIGYPTHVQTLIEAQIDPDEAVMYLEGALGLLEIVKEDTGVELLEHGFTLSLGPDEPDITVSRTATVANTPGVRKYFPDSALNDDDVVVITFDGDIDLFMVTVNDEELDYQACHEKSGCKCLKRLLGIK